MDHSFPHAKPAADLPIGTTVTIDGGRPKKLIYTKTGPERWNSNVETGLPYAHDNAVGWWLTHRAHKTTVALPS